MRLSDVVSELELEMEEPQNQRDKRVEELWKKLDPAGHGELDLKGLQKGLRRIDHPLKNADEMLKDIISAVDTSGDGKIQYEEFRVFVEAAERQLLQLFRSIDRDKDGRLNKEELQAAFRRAGLSVPKRRLSGFFDEIDLNHDGFITFDEWRDFLLFMPTNHNGSPLEAAFSFYSSIVTVNPEGDSLVSDETLEGLGTAGFLLHALFGSLLRIANPDLPTYSPRRSAGADRLETSKSQSPPPSSSYLDQLPELPADMAASAATVRYSPPVYGSPVAVPPQVLSDAAVKRPVILQYGGAQQSGAEDVSDLVGEDPARVATRLTDLLPDPGYFLAGAVSGGVSRTATAPLDRLKVYLLVNTKTSSNVAIAAAKQGRPLVALRNAGGPIVDAIVSLWKAGGLRTFFAGNGLNVVKIMPESAIRFGSYEASKRFLAAYEGHNDPTQISTVSKFIAGGIGGMTAQFCVYPIDTLKFRLQCETVKGGPQGNALLLRTARKMWADGGLRAAYRGLGLGLVGMFPYSAIDIGTFELLKKSYTRAVARYYGIHEDDAQLSNVATAVLGATSGALGATIVYPLNVLRTRLQTQGTAMHPPTYTGIVDVATKTVRNEGVRGLYKGLTPNLLKVAPALSITWVCYENMKSLLKLN
ncbi:ef2e8f01-a678-410d-b25d-0e303925158c [Thermothielavioides terrestris]|uniref:Mitochondrial thiamine pyrophosphate carrier 1 n=1 Tax=Thermothielavioides terrestris TaxID=2587410 RepID=A0A3S5CWB0_9PEZI|nr:ef2e8f01-a678-410d-b25d-0e303925158c [Thermothielavioides terrestris]